ncbi:hypothetical protein GF336_03570 [Candidatus Woesearchaeota archaeon]|nr:hypothetical protein [Candidatus Woesearchaeota archaeon]
MFEKFSKKPFKERLKDTGFLIKNSFTIIGKDKDIKTPLIHMIVLSVIILTIILFASVAFFLDLEIIWTLLIAIAIFLIVFRFFYDVRQKADQSWIVYNTLIGKDISYKDSHDHTSSEKRTLTFIAIVNILMKYAGSQRNKKKGIMGILINLFLAALIEVWDLLSHYMLPAVVIEQRPLKELIPQIKSLRNNVPATLAGVFGIDFVGDIVGSLLIPVYFIFLLLSVLAGYLISLFTEFTIITIFGFSFSWIPIVAMMYIILLFGSILGKIVESIKVIYFTIFYTSLTRPMSISPSMRDNLTNYLLMKESDFTTFSRSTPHSRYIDQLADYISQYKHSGYSENQIIQFLISKGYPQKDINEASRKANNYQRR